MTVETGQPAAETPKDDYVQHSVEAEKATAPEAPKEAPKEATEEPSSEARKKPGGYVKKLNQREAELAQERERNAKLAAELEQLRSGTPKQTETPKLADGEPSENDYESYGDYIKAWTKWDNREAIKQFQTEQTRQAEEAKKNQTYDAKVQSHEQRIAALAETDANFDPAVYDQRLLEVMQKGLISQQLEDAVLDSDISEKITLHLLDNPQELMALQGLGEIALNRAIAKIEARLENNQTVKATVKMTKASPPISPVKSNSSGNTKALDELPYDEYKQEMDKRDREKRR